MTQRSQSLPSRRSIRLPGYDYRNSGAYFVTVCAYQKSRLFGHVREGKMIVNDLGMTVSVCWQRISQLRQNVTWDAFVVMPNHLHGIVMLLDEEPIEVARQNNGKTITLNRSLKRGSLGVVIGQFKRAVTIKSRLLAQPLEQPIWQRNYYEHIIRNESSLDDIRKYIVENPATWHDDSLYVH